MRSLCLVALALAAAQPPAPEDLKKPDSPPGPETLTRPGADKAAAWRSVVQAGPDALLDVLAAMDGADRLTANWLRTAAEAIVEQAQAAKKPLPADRLLAFVQDRKHAPQARRLA
jgi:hypothetical protein